MPNLKLTDEQLKNIAKETSSTVPEVQAHVQAVNNKMGQSVGNTHKNRQKLEQKIKIFTNEFNATCEFDKEAQDWTPETKELIDFLVLKWNEWCAENALQHFGPLMLAEIRTSKAVKMKDRRQRLEIFAENMKAVKAETVEELHNKLKEGRKDENK